MARAPMPPPKKGKAGNNDRNNERNGNGGKGKNSPFGGKRAAPFGKPPARGGMRGQ